jgi:hypothetical protein
MALFPQCEVFVRRYSRFLFLSALWFSGCDQTAGPAKPPAGSAAPAAAVATIRTPDELHAALQAKNPNYTGAAQIQANGESIVAVDLRDTGVVDLSPLAGLPLAVLYAENTGVTDLSPLKGMRLVELSLSDTPVAEIGPLRGMPLKILRMVNTKVRDLSPLKGAPLEQLWVNNTPVSDIGPLAGAPLVSLTVEGTRVSDINVVKQLPLLERLNLAHAPVADLTPVAGLRLTRLVFDPKAATTGIDAVRSMPTIREIGPTMEQMGRPDQFWPAYDSGAFK